MHGTTTDLRSSRELGCQVPSGQALGPKTPALTPPNGLPAGGSHSRGSAIPTSAGDTSGNSNDTEASSGVTALTIPSGLHSSALAADVQNVRPQPPSVRGSLLPRLGSSLHTRTNTSIGSRPVSRHQPLGDTVSLCGVATSSPMNQQNQLLSQSTGAVQPPSARRVFERRLEQSTVPVKSVGMAGSPLFDVAPPPAVTTPPPAPNGVLTAAGTIPSSRGLHKVASVPPSECIDQSLTKALRPFLQGYLDKDMPDLSGGPGCPLGPSDGSFLHTLKSECPRHSRAAAEAQEAARVKLVQQQHHDEWLISQGGREVAPHHMKSSASLAGSLSRRCGSNARTEGVPRPVLDDSATMRRLPRSEALTEEAAVATRRGMRNGAEWVTDSQSAVSSELGMARRGSVVVELQHCSEDEDEDSVDDSPPGPEWDKRPPPSSGAHPHVGSTKHRGQDSQPPPVAPPTTSTLTHFHEISGNTTAEPKVTTVPSRSAGEPTNRPASTSGSRSNSGGGSPKAAVSVTPLRRHKINYRGPIDDSDSSGAEEEAMTCCHCCPCRKPENFLLLMHSRPPSTAATLTTDRSGRRVLAYNGARKQSLSRRIDATTSEAMDHLLTASNSTDVVIEELEVLTSSEQSTVITHLCSPGPQPLLGNHMSSQNRIPARSKPNVPNTANSSGEGSETDDNDSASMSVSTFRRRNKHHTQ